MWATSPPLSAQSVERPSRWMKAPVPSAPASPPPLASPHQQSLSFSQNLADLLEPAVDGPPSPESIRALSQQMRQTSAQDKHHSRQTPSSGSSSLRSLASSDRPSWENAFDVPPASAGAAPLSRKSSGRSTTSSMPSRPDKTESVQIFGKSLFSRKGRLRRESSAQSSASSSLYSADMPAEAIVPVSPPPAVSGNTKPSLFSRRKTTRPDSVLDDASEARRRLQISGPYDFRHLTHTQKENLPNLQRASRMALQSEFTAIRASQVPSNGSLKGIQAEDIHFADFSTESLPLTDDGPASAGASRVSLGQPRGPLHRSYSQDQIRMMPPPRPFRKPDDPEFGTPEVPPRISSRTSMSPHDPADVFANSGYDDREGLQISAGVREAPRLPATLEEGDERGAEEDGDFLQMRPRVRADSQVVPAEYRYSRVISATPDDLNWPLTTPLSGSFEAGLLPDVPEEEENTVPARSRASVTSNSSLRGSQSVPLLRNLLNSQPAPAPATTSQRPPSNASDTLGRFDMLAAQRALKAALEESKDESLTRESWEDDIDYCYEHEVEADCEYAWDRPSFDSSREDESVTPVELGTRGNMSPVSSSSPTLLNPGRFDVPALSPASQVSTSTAVEAFTPTSMSVPTPSSSATFTLPRHEQHQQPLHQQSTHQPHARNPSYASTFKESHGLNLSPTLLIPGSDFHRHMMLSEEPEWYPGQDEISYVPPYKYEEPVLTMDRSALLIHSRTSASTMASVDSEDAMGSDRHISTASDSTALTRLTLSSSSVNMAGLAAAPSSSSATAAAGQDETCSAIAIATSNPPSPQVTKAEPSSTRTRGQSEPLSARSYDGSSSNSKNVFDEAFGSAQSRSGHGATTTHTRNFSHIMPTSPIKTKDDAAAVTRTQQQQQQQQLPQQRKEAVVAAATRPAGRPRAKTTTSLASPPASMPYSLFPAVNMAVSRM